MHELTIEQAMQAAVRHHQAGRMADAEGIYRQVLERQPNHANALHLLGLIAHQVGRNDLAVDLIRRAIAIAPKDASYHCNLGSAYQVLGRMDEAVVAYLTAIQIKPDFAEGYFNFGTALSAQGKLGDAVVAYSRAVKLKPGFAEAYFNLGVGLDGLGKPEQAIAAYTRASELKPNYAEAWNNLGNILKSQRKLDEAVSAYSKAVTVRADYAEAFSNLGIALSEQMKFDEAVTAYQKAIQLKPDLAEAHNNLGNALCDLGKLDLAVAACSWAIHLKPDMAAAHGSLGNALNNQGKMDEAIAAFTTAIGLDPNYAEAHGNLGRALKDQGLMDEALAETARAMELKPADPIIHSNRAYMLHYHPAYDAAAIFSEHRLWNEQHAAPLKKLITPYSNSRQPDRRLKIGYVSPDFRWHPVGRFFLPLVENHDRGAFEIFCYSGVLVADALTERCRSRADAWRNIVGLSDERVARMVREDGIDILVDLTMHMTHQRLLVFARKPAPVQVTYLAYCSTTGLDAIDYRFTDPYFDPPGLGDEHYSEKSIRLEETYWCYDPGTETPDVGPLPGRSNGVITFGCLNNFCKVSPGTIGTWCRILREVPQSRLVLHAREGSHRNRVVDCLTREGIDPSRLRFVGLVPTAEYFQQYQEMDLCLDPFPCAGGTTTCDALWMGVPVVTLAGRTAVGRAGVSILTNIGLPELIAATEDQYVNIAADLARDMPRLAALRASLRERMRQSPLMNAPRFARNVENAYRNIWRKWCGV